MGVVLEKMNDYTGRGATAASVSVVAVALVIQARSVLAPSALCQHAIAYLHENKESIVTFTITFNLCLLQQMSTSES